MWPHWAINTFRKNEAKLILNEYRVNVKLFLLPSVIFLCHIYCHAKLCVRLFLLNLFENKVIISKSSAFPVAEITRLQKHVSAAKENI